MRRSGTLIAVVSAALLVAAAAAPAVAAIDPGKASGALAWYGYKNGELETALRTSVFRVRDGAPGTATATGDRGWYYLKKQGVGSMSLRVSCALVDGNKAQFAGQVTRATGGTFTVGNVFVVSVKDVGRSDDKIGMKSITLKSGDSWATPLEKACDKHVLAPKQIQRKGVIQRGNIRVRDPR